jgi:xylulose-5-phosphate/fructose-6-phosphate phosphoketolase
VCSRSPPHHHQLGGGVWVHAALPRGSEAERDATMPFDMCVVNDLARFHGVGDVIDRLPRLGAYFKQAICHKLIEHREYIVLHGGDLPEIAGGGLGHATALGALRSTEADSV